MTSAEMDVVRAEAQLAEATSRRICELDEQQSWIEICQLAKKVIPRQILVARFACSWSTYTRWLAGRCEPGLATKKAFKAGMVELLNDASLVRSQVGEADER